MTVLPINRMRVGAHQTVTGVLVCAPGCGVPPSLNRLITFGIEAGFVFLAPLVCTRAAAFAFSSRDLARP